MSRQPAQTDGVSSGWRRPAKNAEQDIANFPAKSNCFETIKFTADKSHAGIAMSCVVHIFDCNLRMEALEPTRAENDNEHPLC